MGRQSPGKWIKNLLQGKKSNSSKKKDSIVLSTKKDVLVVSSEASMPSPIVVSPPTSGANATNGLLPEEKIVTKSSNENVFLSVGDEQANAQALVNFNSEDHVHKIRLTEAAITTQAAFRGYQVRRTFQTLKGIIPLQAFIRGQLVRRQAVTALFCVKGIVKFQALARGYSVRHSNIGLQVQKVCKDTKFSNSTGLVTSTQAEKLSDNVFVHKLQVSSPYAVSLYPKYGAGELNMSWDWLDRWTRSQFWAPLPELKKKSNLVPDEKNGSCYQTVEGNNDLQVQGKSCKAPAVSVDNSVSDSNKWKRHPEKDSNTPLHSKKKHPQKENEKSHSKKTNKQNEKRKSSDHTISNVSQHGLSDSAEKIKDLAVSKSKLQSDLQKSIGQKAADKHGGGGFIEDLNGGDKNYQRRASLPANFNDHLHNTPRLPSYMTPTESAKAKLRGQGSPRFINDLVDKNSINRRLSLSTSLNGKLGLFSPRAERLAANKGVTKTDRSLSSSRDWTDKLIQPQWRR